MVRLLFGLITGLLFGMQVSTSIAQAVLARGDTEAIQSVINLQLAAFKADDGDEALKNASPRLQAQFRSSDTSSRMVEQGDQPVYLPKSIFFGCLVNNDRGPRQHAIVITNSGVTYTPVYVMAWQPTGECKITGCYLRAHPTTSA